MNTSPLALISWHLQRRVKRMKFHQENNNKTIDIDSLQALFYMLT